MKINADFDGRVAVQSTELDWVPSPMKGVDRRMLDRIGEEVARATSIVRYAPGSSFSEHTHDGGEEFIVLDGVFQDEHGDYPAGTYVRNPPRTHHVPGSAPGCTIFVKLWQFDPEDRNQFSVDMNSRDLKPVSGFDGVSEALLHSDDRETVKLLKLSAGATFTIGDIGGAEALVLAGSIKADGESLGLRGWLRLPPDDRAEITVGGEGAKLWIKTGHLTDVTAPAL